MAIEYEKRMLLVQTCIHNSPSGDMSLDTLADLLPCRDSIFGVAFGCSGRKPQPKRDIAGLPHKWTSKLIGREFEHLFTTLDARGLIGRTGTKIGADMHDPESTPEPVLRSFAGTEFPATDYWTAR
jgi:hypothetical protein